MGDLEPPTLQGKLQCKSLPHIPDITCGVCNACARQWCWLGMRLGLTSASEGLFRWCGSGTLAGERTKAGGEFRAAFSPPISLQADAHAEMGLAGRDSIQWKLCGGLLNLHF